MKRTILKCSRLALSTPKLPSTTAAVPPFSTQLHRPKTSQPPWQLSSRAAATGCCRCIHSNPSQRQASRPPKSRDRGPKSSEETQTDFGALDVLRNTAAPATAIDSCHIDGFALNNQTVISGSGVLLVGGEPFRWRPWLKENGKEGTVAEGATGGGVLAGRLLNAKSQWDVPSGAWGVLELVWPKPGMIACHHTLITSRFI